MLALPSMENQAPAQQLQPSCEPAWCRSQLHLGMKPWGFQTRSWRCLGICNFQQELGVTIPPQDPIWSPASPLLGSEQSRVRQLLEESSLFYCRQKARLVSVTRSRYVSLPKPFPNPKSRDCAAEQPGRMGSLLMAPSKPPLPREGICRAALHPPKQEEKGRISGDVGLSPQEWHLPAGFYSAPVPHAAFQAAALCRQPGVGDEAVFSATIDITAPFSYTVISLFRALNAKW